MLAIEAPLSLGLTSVIWPESVPDGGCLDFDRNSELVQAGNQRLDASEKSTENRQPFTIESVGRPAEASKRTRSPFRGSFGDTVLVLAVSVRRGVNSQPIPALFGGQHFGEIERERKAQS